MSDDLLANINVTATDNTADGFASVAKNIKAAASNAQVAISQGITAETKKSTETMQRFQKTAQDTLGSGGDGLGGLFLSAGNSAAQLAGALGVAFSVKGAIDFGVQSVRSFASVEESQIRLAHATQITDDQQKQLTDDINKMSRVTGKSTNELTQQFTDFATTSTLKIDDLLKLFPQLQNYARVTGSDFANAASMANNAVNMYGVQSNDLISLFDTLAHELPTETLTNRFNIVQSHAAEMFKSLGFGTKESMEQLAAFTNRMSALAGTGEHAQRTFMSTFSQFSGNVNKILSQEYVATRDIAFDAQKNGDTLIDVMKKVDQRFTDQGLFGQENRQRLLNFFSKDAGMRDFAVWLHDNIAVIEQLSLKMKEGGESVADSVKKLNDSSSASLNNLSASWDKLGVAAGKAIVAMGAGTVMDTVSTILNQLHGGIDTPEARERLQKATNSTPPLFPTWQSPPPVPTLVPAMPNGATLPDGGIPEPVLTGKLNLPPGYGDVRQPRGQPPRLAAGAVVTSPTVAMIGEAGPEAVVPLRGPGRGPQTNSPTVRPLTQDDVSGLNLWGGAKTPTKIPHLAAGGIVSAPTVAMIGEAGPEAIVPLHHGGGDNNEGVDKEVKATEKNTAAIGLLTNRVTDLIYRNTIWGGAGAGGGSAGAGSGGGAGTGTASGGSGSAGGALGLGPGGWMGRTGGIGGGMFGGRGGGSSASGRWGSGADGSGKAGAGAAPTDYDFKKTMEATGLDRGAIDAVRGQLQEKESGGKYGLNDQGAGPTGNFGAYQYNENDVGSAAKYFGEAPPSRQQLLSSPGLQEKYLEGYWLSRMKTSGLDKDPEFQKLKEQAAGGDQAARKRMAEVLISEQTSQGREALHGKPWAGDRYHGSSYWTQGLDERLAKTHGGETTSKDWSDLPARPGHDPELKTIDPRLREILSAGRDQFEAMNPGYKVTASSGRRHGANEAQHGSPTGAIDTMIVGPDGKEIANEGVEPQSGPYHQLARLSFGEMQARHPELAGKFAWGGAFGTQTTAKGGGGPPDLMHFDIGGERGHWSNNLMSNMGPLPGRQYGKPPEKQETQEPHADLTGSRYDAGDQVSKMRKDIGNMKPIRVPVQPSLPSRARLKTLSRQETRWQNEGGMRDSRWQQSSDIGYA